MKEQIPINDNMPDDLKAAINYLNENQISLSDKFDDEDEELDSIEDDSFEEENFEDDSFEEVDDIDIDFGEADDMDDLDEEDESVLSDLNSIF